MKCVMIGGSVILAILLAFPAASLGDHWFVPLSHPTIQAAINDAQDGDIVMVGPGVYRGHIDFLGKAITVRSSHGAEKTVIDGRVIPHGDLGSVVTFAGGETRETVLEGFTITNGRGTVVRGSIDSARTVRTILDGTTTAVDPKESVYGGGIVVRNGASPTIRHNVIADNVAAYGTASQLEAGIGFGGGIYCGRDCAPVIDGNAIRRNRAGDAGGGIYCAKGSHPVIVNNEIRDNLARQGAGIYGFAGLEAPQIIHDTIVGNFASERGGGLAVEGFPWQITVTNTILWKNDAVVAPQIWSSVGTPFVDCADIEGGWHGEGIIDADPKFQDPTNGDLHLSAGSPCVDTGRNCLILPRSDCDGDCRVADGNLDGFAVADLGADEVIFGRDERLVPQPAELLQRLSLAEGQHETAFRVADPIPLFQLEQDTTYFQRAVCVPYSGGRVVLASNPDGIGQVGVNDEMRVTVVRADGTTATLVHDFSDRCSGHTQLEAPKELTELVKIGLNQVTIEIRNVCGTKGSATPLWVVLLPNEEDDVISREPFDCMRGNVNALVGNVADVLHVNGTAGDGSWRVVRCEDGESVEVWMDEPPSRPAGPSAFVLYAWAGQPSTDTVQVLPVGLGISCMPTPLTLDAAPQPLFVWNNLGFEQKLGEADFPSVPAPSLVLGKPGGIGRIGTYFLQGLIVDEESPSRTAAVTNGIVLVVE